MDQVVLFEVVEVLNVVNETLIKLVGDGHKIPVVILVTLICQCDLKTFIQKGHLLEPGAQGFVIELDRFKNLSVGVEGNCGAGFV